jgi:hypothetical protein
MNDSATHVYCNACGEICPMIQEPLTMVDDSGKYQGGDLLCAVCAFVVATVYREASPAEEA